MSADPRIEPAARALYEYDRNASCSPDRWPDWDSPDNNGREIGRDMATAALAAADKAATITTVEGLEALPVGSRVVMGDYYILREEHSVDDGVWLDLGNGLRLDADDLRIIIESYPARIIRWGTE